MILRRIELDNFRSYEHKIYEPLEGVNIIRGENASGKTNLLESIHFLTGTGSFRTSRDGDMVLYGADSFRIRANIFSDGREQKLEIRRDGQGRTYFLNDVRKKRKSDIIGVVRCVSFCPDDLELIKGAGVQRRRFLDISISQLRPNYASLVSEYGKLLAHKARILRDHRKKPSLLESLDDFTSQLLSCGARIITYRKSFCQKLGELASIEHSSISGEKEDLSVSYSCPFLSENVKNLYLEMWQKYLERKEDEITREMILVGPHRDELAILIDGRPAKDFASQGQIRTAVLSLVLAKRALYHDNTGEYPIMLLDDVLSELDAARREYLLGKIREGQVFITTCEDL
ncbi:MAG: DNA replication/repair protein RecF [Clostridiales bacterium]|nr:DNA replication/repair protein RecF [Clostridiales bacterium]